MPSRTSWFRVLLAALSLVATLVAADKSEPDIKVKKFDHPPVNLFFFDDSEVALIVDQQKGIVRRSTNAGEDWDVVDDIKKEHPYAVYPHPYNNQVAVALGRRKTHWITYNQGKDWREFDTEDHPSPSDPLTFHAGDPKKVLFHTERPCIIFDSCPGKTYYTTDGFEHLKLLHSQRRTCLWAKGTPDFGAGDDTVNDNTVVCIVAGRFSLDLKDYRLITSDDFFKTEHEPAMSSGRTITGFQNMAPVKGFIVAAAKALLSRELALYVTRDARTWHRAEFGSHKIEEDAYTVLESTNYSIQVDVMSHRQGMTGALFTSNSNGTYFTRNIEHTNRNRLGLVDFEKIQNIQGIVLVNTVENWEEVEKRMSQGLKKIKSKISFDDGRTFEALKVGDEELHLHSVTNQRNVGRIFSSPAPGIVMGVGNTGDFLDDYSKASLFVSDDAGKTWKTTPLKGPQKWEFGDQGSILFSVAETNADEVSYSINHGRDWKTAKLPVTGVSARELTTIPDSTSLKFVLVATKGEDFYVFSLDFDDLDKRKCGDDDFEKWYARKDKDGKPTCIMGHKQSFKRRKPDADCFIKTEFREILPENEACECEDADFECDFDFVRSDDGKCEPVGRVPAPTGVCKNADDKFKGSSGWRLIPGNDCKRKSGAQKDDLVERPCSEALSPPASGKVSVQVHEFREEQYAQFFYLERDPKASGHDETIVMLSDQNKLYITKDHGKSWKQVTKDEKILAIYPHQFNQDYVYFITPSRKVYYSEDRGETIHSFEAPDIPAPGISVINFHENNPDWLLWIGRKDCRPGSKDCHTLAHVSKKNGQDWDVLLRSVDKCQFMYREGRSKSEQLIYCTQHQADDHSKPKDLVYSEDWFDHKTQVFEDVVNFATMSEFIVVAAKDKDFLKVDASVDGRQFAPAAFPPNFQVEHQTAYTVLDSSTNAVFLHVTVNGEQDHEYGSILKSNSNGTSYVLTLNNVNRNRRGYVDFEKMQGLEGVAIVNVVANPKEVDNGAPKKLKTMITHDDGSDWAYLSPPAKDFLGKSYPCAGKGLDKCALHLHGYTERTDPRDTYSSPSAVGLMLGVGNVGEHLGPANEGDTFITRDGGITWIVAKNGIYMWEYGDQGAIVVLVKKNEPTNMAFYSVDEGDTWQEFQFSDTNMRIEKISTVPSDNSRNFVLWGHLGSRLTTVNLDFTGLADKPCKLDKENLDDSDYWLWTPKHPLKKEESDCLFGHQAQYYRKRTDRVCFNGPPIDRLHDIGRNCSCTRQDFECDYNFERQPDGTCRLVPGLQPADPMQVCRDDPSAFEYHDVTPYRRIPISTCTGGREMDFASQTHPCPGKEDEYVRKRGPSGFALFFAIVLPIAAASGVGYWVWRNWDGKFGRIRENCWGRIVMRRCRCVHIGCCVGAFWRCRWCFGFFFWGLGWVEEGWLLLDEAEWP
ncbi:vacuolar protein sorting protein [Trichodelitschia bisporula]|uniref:Vacuolar protein sorting/targeting protein 10 n=1 Tax=Trichodelitschia bisporula TaxID=703511 RepID=A0A6G1I744_9PEZI|nr:vacuolar protein sorting protein [Trichodelitschia bisporula]